MFHIEFQHACQRKFDSHGKEVEPNFGATQLVRTGYLQSSYSKYTIIIHAARQSVVNNTSKKVQM